MRALLAFAILAGIFVAWWLVFKIRAGVSGVKAHRQLLATDRYYRHLNEMAGNETAVGETRGHFQEQAQLHLLEHLHAVEKLTADEHAQAVLRVRQQFRG